MAIKISYGWIKKEQTKSIEATSSRTNVSSWCLKFTEISKPIVCSYPTVDGESIVNFLGQVRKCAGIKGIIHLILDQAGYHTRAEVIKEAKKLNIKLLYLPTYSPNLNSIERL